MAEAGERGNEPQDKYEEEEQSKKRNTKGAGQRHSCSSLKLQEPFRIVGRGRLTPSPPTARLVADLAARLPRFCAALGNPSHRGVWPKTFCESGLSQPSQERVMHGMYIYEAQERPLTGIALLSTL